ncbi:MAG: tetratricopeptide repeat protein, partial [Armatimonadota bacterium]
IIGADASDQWLMRGLTFDIEKRLGRLSNLEPVDRLELASALRTAANIRESAKVAAVVERVKPDFVLYASGTLAKGRLDVVVRVWTDSSSPSTSFSSSAEPDRLFSLIDDLVEKIVAYLRVIHVGVGEAHSTSALHLQPSRSVNVYRLIIRGMTLLQEGSTAAASSDLLKALDAEPNNWWTNYFLGAVEFHERHLKEAIVYCLKAIALDPDLYPGVYANLSYCYQGLGNSDQAKWARTEFERRTGKPLPSRSLPGSSFSMSYPGNR